MSIEAISFALPSVRQTARDIAGQTGANHAFIADKVGVAERYVLGEHETGVSLATQACEKLFERYPDLRGSVELIVCVTQNPDRRIPHNSPQIACEIGLGDHVASFDISLGCSGYVYGVEIVEGFLTRCGLDNAILVTCDPYSRIIAAEDRDTNCLFGDAATATWIRSSGRRSLTLATDFGSDGSKGTAISIPYGGATHPLVCLGDASKVNSYERDQLRLHMNGRAVFNFVLDRVPKSIETCLRRADCSIDQIEHFVLHQGSAFMLDAVSRKIGIPPSRLATNIRKYGNVVSSSIPLLLAELDQAGQLDHGLVLMSGFGVGLSWGTSIVQFG